MRSAQGETDINGQANRWLSVHMIADDLELSEATVRRMIKKGGIPAYKIGGEYRIPAHEYATWLEDQRVRPEEV